MVTVSAGAVVTAAVYRPGVYSANPSNPASQASTSGSGTGATFTLTFNGGSGSGMAGFSPVAVGATDARLNFLGTGPSVNGGNSVQLGGIDTQCAFEWTTDSDVVEARFTAYNTSFQVFVDGQRLASTPYSTDASGGRYVMTLTQADRTPRTYRVVGVNLQFVGAYVPSTGTIWKPNEPRRPLALVIGDSYTQGTGATDATACANNVMAEILGIDILCNGVGGAGWISSTAGSPTARITGTFPSLTTLPEIVFLDLGHNDAASAPDTTAIGASIDSTIAAIRSYVPKAKIVLFGPATPVGDTANLTTMRTTISARATANSCTFVDVQGWVTSANKALYTGGDNVHPTAAGHIYLGERRARLVAAALA